MKNQIKKKVKAILLLYHRYYKSNAGTIMEHVNSFSDNSNYMVFPINTEDLFFSPLKNYEFDVIILHYSLFGWLPFQLSKVFKRYIAQCKNSYKIAFFQDEYRFWSERITLLKELDVQCIYTLIKPENFGKTYRKYLDNIKLIYNLPSYVSSELMERWNAFIKPENERKIDIGYRGRISPFYMGRGGQEKSIIGEEFEKHAIKYGLKMDISSKEDKRIYGNDWPRFLANCKAVLGVEAGVSVFDIDDEVRIKFSELVGGHPELTVPSMSFEEVHKKLLAPYENNIYYRTISPRHFEAAALKVCQILFEGNYSGILKPDVHYIPLKKDFSNFEEVMKKFRDQDFRKRISENAYEELIASKKYTYSKMIHEFDNLIASEGIVSCSVNDDSLVIIYTIKYKLFLALNFLRRQFLKLYYLLRYINFPGRKILKRFYRSIFKYNQP